MRYSQKSVIVVAVLAIVMLAGCTAQQPGPRQPTASDAPAEKTGTGELRHDTAPLTDRFAQLEGLVSTSWMSGTFGNSPGPSLYWIDAVVELSPEQYELLTSGVDAPVGHAPPVVDGLTGALPEGSFSRSAELESQFSPDPYRTDVYLNDEAHTLVILSVFE